MAPTKATIAASRDLALSDLLREAEYVESLDEFSEETIERLIIMKAELPAMYKLFKDFEDKLQLQGGSSELSAQVRNRYLQVLSRINVLIKRHTPVQSEAGSSPHHVTPSSSLSAGNLAPKIRLPEIPIPRFNGDQASWMRFSDLFTRIVISNADLTEADKFYYLLEVLSGDASRVIADLPVTPDTFQAAWKQLSERYENKREIAAAHIRNLFSPPANNADSADAIHAIMDHMKSNLNALQALKLDVAVSDLMCAHIVQQALHADSLRAWEEASGASDLPSLSDFFRFLERRARVLKVRTIRATPTRDGGTNDGSAGSIRSRHAPTQASVKGGLQPPREEKCTFCKQSHSLWACQQYRDLPVHKRIEHANRAQLCKNCLRKYTKGHICSKRTCNTCNKLHHTLLHMERGAFSALMHAQSDNPDSFYPEQQAQHAVQREQQSAQWPIRQDEMADMSSPHDSMTRGNASRDAAHIGVASVGRQPKCLFPTASLRVRASDGQLYPCTAILDSGSNVHLISEALLSKLALPVREGEVNINSINAMQTVASHKVRLQLSSPITGWKQEIVAVSVPQIATPSLQRDVNTKNWQLPAGIPLADPQFDKARPVDLLLGAQLVFSLLEPGKITLHDNLPTLLASKLGYLISGGYGGDDHAATNYDVSLLTTTEVDRRLERFWEIENFPATKPPTPEEEICERHFVETHERTDGGQFVVSLPRTCDSHQLLLNRTQAEKRFFSLERRLARNPELREQYKQFMQEYEDLGHMRPSTDEEIAATRYIIPHHPVFKDSSTSTKLRVVFDASAKGPSGISFNDTLLNGGTLQDELFLQLIRFRTYPVAFSADVEKMYRGVLLSPDEYPYHTVLWRSDPSEELRQYTLLTLTYGVKPSAFEATRALRQLADDDGHDFPLATDILRSHFYVDDVISGATDADTALQIFDQLSSLLRRGQFTLRKWASNSAEFLQQIPDELREKEQLKAFTENDLSIIRTLGLLWHAQEDVFLIDTHADSIPAMRNFTKRRFLSAVSAIWDPLGMVSPAIVPAKILFQQLWILKLDWDDPLPPDVNDKWLKILSELPKLADIRIPRLVLQQCSNPTYALHGFADASDVAYGSCLYLVTRSPEGTSTSRLIAAKSRVAPVKRVCIPRLELCAALLLARLINKISPAFAHLTKEIHLWTDSTTALTWIKSIPARWHVFIANRVSEIQTLTHDAEWHYVPSKQNPADVISRGVAPSQLGSLRLWWQGPEFLLGDPAAWPEQRPPTTTNTTLFTCEGTPEATPAADPVSVTSAPFHFLQASFSYERKIRIAAYVSRFLSNCKLPVAERALGPLTDTDIDRGVNYCARILQAHHYKREIKALRNHENISSKSPIAALAPFLHNGVLRVGGRLEHSPLIYATKHQIIMPPKALLTRDLIRAKHRVLLHAGPQLVMAAIREEIWVPRLRSVARDVISKCVTCFRFKPQSAQQLMGDLPAPRVSPASPFNSTSVDYCGPITMKYGSPRSQATTKAYFAIFVCMATRAVHVELVSKLSTEAFLAAFDRFVSRRGLPRQVYSDNATNFRGAAREIRRVQNLLDDNEVQDKIIQAGMSRRIIWHFNPPAAPHFGGLHEAAVKAFKHHFRRVTQGRILTFEEAMTLATSVEGLLNSRPLLPLTEEPTDLTYLSPGHFLIGKPILAPPHLDHGTTPHSRLTRWQRVQAMTKAIWKFWSRSYLQELQRRAKWRQSHNNIQIGTIVLLNDDNLPSHMWRMGVVEEVTTGADERVRVARVRTSTGVFLRAVRKLSPLPLDSEPTTLASQPQHE